MSLFKAIVEVPDIHPDSLDFDKILYHRFVIVESENREAATEALDTFVDFGNGERITSIEPYNGSLPHGSNGFLEPI